MKKLFITLVMGLFIASCGGGGGGSSTTGGGGTGATTTAVQSSSAGTSAVSASTGTTTTFQNISKISVTGAGLGAPKFKTISIPSGNPGLDKAAQLTARMGDSPLMKTALTKARMAAKMGTKVPAAGQCTDGGTYTGSATSGTNFSVTFTNCKESNNMYDGIVSMTLGTVSGSSVPITMSFAGNSSSTFDITSFSGTYSVAVMKMSMNLSLVNTFTVNGAQVTYDMVADGTMNITDYSTTNTYATTFTGFGNSVVINGTSITTTISGTFAESWSNAGVASSISATYTGFTIAITDDGTNTTLSPSGTVSIAYVPSSVCAVTSVTVATVTPINFVNATGATNAGQITLNTTTTVTFNADGTVSVNDGTNTTNFANSFDMGKECPFAVPNPDTAAPPVTTSTTTTGVTASTMTVTSVSHAGTITGSLACYTDLHVNFYSTTTPTSTTAGTWKVDWHNGLGCTNPSTFTFEEAQDINNDGICDVGLDINGSATDDTSGGLEHFTALTLPTGYYVISMNNFSCALDTVNDVSIQLGNNVYGPYTSPAYTATGEGIDLGAWFRVRDVRVNADGSVDVLAPDTTLEPWHTGAFGMAPKYGPKRR